MEEPILREEKNDYNPPRPVGMRPRGAFLFLLFAAVFGFVGGLLSPLATRFYDEKVAPVNPLTSEADKQAAKEKVMAPGDDAIVALVEKNSPAVVSIIITKDVPQARRFFSSPFGGRSPFFFDPFQEDPGTGSGETERRQIGSGSGFLVTADGLIVTNKHVVSDTEAEYTVIMNDTKEYPAKILARSPNNDIAVLKIEGKDFPFLTLGDSDTVKVGETAVAIGNPLGEFANSVSRGIISGLKRSVSAGNGLGASEQLSDIIQTDAAVNPGNSGGPLFTLSGEVIGVNVAMALGAENIAFALPINPVKKIVEQVKTTGKISIPYLGVRYIIVNDDIKKQNNLPYAYGALVLRGQTVTDFAVIPGSPADKAGIVENDIILEIGGTKIDEEHPLSTLINNYNVGQEVTVKVWHKGETKDMRVRLEERS